MENVTERNLTIDGWRGISVLLVIYSHLTHSGSNFGYIGVFIFFLLSGYIIAKLSFKEISRTGDFNQYNFIVRRCLRILPPLFLYIAFLLVYHNFSDQIIGYSLRSFSFSCNIAIGDGCGWILGHTWSLAFEEQFYLLFPFLVLRRFSVVLLALFPLLLMPFFYPLNFIGKIGYFQIVSLLCMGIIYAKYHLRVDEILSKINPLYFLPLIVFPFWWTTLEPAVWQKILAMFVPPTIFVMVFILPKISWIGGVVKSKLLSTIGLYSYTIYLWQQFFTASNDEWSLWRYAAGMILLFVIAKISYDYYESYFRKLSSKFR